MVMKMESIGSQSQKERHTHKDIMHGVDRGWNAPLVLFAAVVALAQTPNYDIGLQPSSFNVTTTTEKPKTLDEKIIYKLKKFKKTIPLGNPASDLPIFDPYMIPYSGINLDYGYFGVNGYLSDIRLKGLKDFEVNDIKVHLVPTELLFNFTLPRLHCKIGHYDLRGKLFRFIPFSKTGKFSFSLNQVKIGGVMSISLKNKLLKILRLKLGGSFDTFNLYIGRKHKNKFFKNIISKTISVILTKLYRLNEESLWMMFGDYVKGIINELVKYSSVKQVIRLLESENDGLLPLD